MSVFLVPLGFVAGLWASRDHLVGRRGVGPRSVSGSSAEGHALGRVHRRSPAITPAVTVSTARLSVAAVVSTYRYRGADGRLVDVALRCRRPASSLYERLNPMPIPS